MTSPRTLFQYEMTTSDEQVTVCPASKQWIITGLYACNTANAARTLRLHVVTDGLPSSTGNALFYDVSLPANSTTELVEAARIPLNDGDELRGLASVASVTLTGFGMEYSV